MPLRPTPPLRMLPRLLRVLLAATLACAASLVAQEARFAVLNKSRAYQQTTTAAVVPHATAPFGFSTAVEGTATDPAPPVSLTLPGEGGTRALTYSAADGEWSLEAAYPTQAALDAAYPNGTYTVTLGARSAPVPFTGDLYPSAPVATLSQGTFAANGTLNFDRAQPLTLTIAYGAGFASGLSRLAIDVSGQGFSREASTEASGFTQSQLALTLPAGAVPPGTQLTIRLEANRILTFNTTGIPGFILGGVYSANTEILAQASGGGAPAILAQPASHTVAPGSTVVLSVAAQNATTYVWKRDGEPLPFAGNSPLLLLTGANTRAGAYTVEVGNATGGTPVTSQPATLTLLAGPDSGRLINLSIRTQAGTAAETLIVGFAVGGAGTSGDKPLLVRAVGPSLAQFGLAGVLADPVATMFQGTATLAANDDWAGDAQVLARATAVGAFPLVSPASLDAALAASPAPGAYSVQIAGKAGATGIALAEIYDASPAATPTTPRLVNVSARTRVGAGGDVLIAGFVLRGQTSRTVLIRAIGPGLAAFGVGGTLADPRLQLFTGATTIVRENDNWGGTPLLVDLGRTVGAFEIADRQSRDAMILVTLPPGSYTTQVSGNAGATGVALVELYEVP